MMIESPEGPNWPYDCRTVNNSDEQPCVQFVRASRLYDVETGTRTRLEATDAEVRAAIEAEESGR